MARTKASVGAKVASGKSSKARCSVASTPTAGPSGTSDKSSRGHSGGNSVHPRETPTWQKPITSFFICRNTGQDSDSDVEAGTSKPKSKKNVIESDEETEPSPKKPKNTELDETIELEPLNGDTSHKIDEYYHQNGVKGKGVGKKTKGKENVDQNQNIQLSSSKKNVKRSRQENDSEIEIENFNKKVRVN